MNTLLELAPVCLETRIKCTDGHMAADLGEEMAILNLKTGTYYGLDGVGSRVWSLLQEGSTLQEIRDTILNEYEVDAKRCEQDLIRLIGDLARHELVQIDDSPLRKI